MPNAAADIFRQAAHANVEDPRRRGNVVELEAGCDIIVTGDVHGNRQAFGRIVAYFERPSARPRRLVLQELIHGPVDETTGQDRSVELLLRAARLKLSRPADVIFLLGNHDLAQVTGREVARNGAESCKAFAEGVRFAFPPDGEAVLAAVEGFIRSMPLAAKCPNGVWITHSLPSPQQTGAAGTEILTRPYRYEDFLRGGPAYEWTWGRAHTDEQIDALAAQLGAELFVLGHRPTQAGIEAIARRAITIASDHSRGCLIEFASDLPLDAQTAVMSATPLATIQ
ncbi:MAG: metallophosphoesterase [Phycisphaerae bacterium]|nr:metallophosphoesterase [Phycisphaerae bacterium]